MTHLDTATRLAARVDDLVDLWATPDRMAELRHRLAGLRRLNLNDRQLADLEMLVTGGFSPLTGFMVEADYRSVVQSMRLRSGQLWPMPVVLDVNDREHVLPGDELLLTDQYGAPVAVMLVESVYRPDRQEEAQLVYDTHERRHPGVRQLLDRTGNQYLGGPVTGIGPIGRTDFPELRLDPRAMRARLAARGWSKVIGFQARSPLHRAHHELMWRAVRDHQAKLLIQPTVGPDSDRGSHYQPKVRSCLRVQRQYLHHVAEVGLLPLAQRLAGPREALWQAIIRRNYGCSHFLVGRDHGGPGTDRRGRPFYHPTAAQELCQKHAAELGLGIISYPELTYAPDERRYLFVPELLPHQEAVPVSGEEVVRRLERNEPLPDWLTFPEVAADLKQWQAKRPPLGVTVFLTGLPCAGKSTIARHLTELLESRTGRPVTRLDGDPVDQHLNFGLNWTREQRLIQTERLGFVASEINRHGGLVVCATIAPFRAGRTRNRRRINETGRYVEVFVDTPLATCRERDLKGRYAQAEAGQLYHFTGVSDPYESPAEPEVIINGQETPPPEAAAAIIEFLERERLL
jgi:sulfate adenylyltransferase